MSGPSRVINVLDEDPDLAERLSAPRLEEARRAAVARLLVLQAGAWSAPEERLAEAGAMGLLVLEGVLVRSVFIEGRPGLELFGAGDLVRPWETTGPAMMAPSEVQWWGLSLVRLAVLDARFTSRMCRYPEVIDALGGRLDRRSSTHALRFAIMAQPRLSEQLHLLLWHLADRFGRVHPEGVVLPVRLPHELLAQLVGARRPSVSRALKELERAEVIARRADGSWLLAQRPPGPQR